MIGYNNRDITYNRSPGHAQSNANTFSVNQRETSAATRNSRPKEDEDQIPSTQSPSNIDKSNRVDGNNAESNRMKEIDEGYIIRPHTGNLNVRNITNARITPSHISERAENVNDRVSPFSGGSSDHSSPMHPTNFEEPSQPYFAGDARFLQESRLKSAGSYYPPAFVSASSEVSGKGRVMDHCQFVSRPTFGRGSMDITNNINATDHIDKNSSYAIPPDFVSSPVDNRMLITDEYIRRTISGANDEFPEKNLVMHFVETLEKEVAAGAFRDAPERSQVAPLSHPPSSSSSSPSADYNRKPQIPDPVHVFRDGLAAGGYQHESVHDIIPKDCLVSSGEYTDKDRVVDFIESMERSGAIPSDHRQESMVQYPERFYERNNTYGPTHFDNREDIFSCQYGGNTPVGSHGRHIDRSHFPYANKFGEGGKMTEFMNPAERSFGEFPQRNSVITPNRFVEGYSAIESAKSYDPNKLIYPPRLEYSHKVNYGDYRCKETSMGHSSFMHENSSRRHDSVDPVMWNDRGDGEDYNTHHGRNFNMGGPQKFFDGAGAGGGFFESGTAPSDFVEKNVVTGLHSFVERTLNKPSKNFTPAEFYSRNNYNSYPEQHRTATKGARKIMHHVPIVPVEPVTSPVTLSIPTPAIQEAPKKRGRKKKTLFDADNTVHGTNAEVLTPSKSKPAKSRKRAVNDGTPDECKNKRKKPSIGGKPNSENDSEAPIEKVKCTAPESDTSRPRGKEPAPGTELTDKKAVTGRKRPAIKKESQKVKKEKVVSKKTNPPEKKKKGEVIITMDANSADCNNTITDIKSTNSVSDKSVQKLSAEVGQVQENKAYTVDTKKKKGRRKLEQTSDPPNKKKKQINEKKKKADQIKHNNTEICTLEEQNLRVREDNVNAEQNVLGTPKDDKITEEKEKQKKAKRRYSDKSTISSAKHRYSDKSTISSKDKIVPHKEDSKSKIKDNAGKKKKTKGAEKKQKKDSVNKKPKDDTEGQQKEKSRTMLDTVQTSGNKKSGLNVSKVRELIRKKKINIKLLKKKIALRLKKKKIAQKLKAEGSSKSLLKSKIKRIRTALLCKVILRKYSKDSTKSESTKGDDKKQTKKKNTKSKKTNAGAKKKKAPLPRDTAAPKHPPSGYLRFMHERREQVRSEGTKMPFAEVTKTVAKEWKEMPLEQKQKYLDEAKKEKEAYDKELAEYRKTDTYKQFKRKLARAKKARNKVPLPPPMSPPDFVKKYMKKKPKKKTKKIQLPPGTSIQVFTNQFLSFNAEREKQFKKLSSDHKLLQEIITSVSFTIDKFVNAIATAKERLQQTKESVETLEERLERVKGQFLNALSSSELDMDEIPTAETIDEYLEKLVNNIEQGIVSDELLAQIKLITRDITFL